MDGLSVRCLGAAPGLFDGAPTGVELVGAAGGAGVGAGVDAVVG